MAAVLADLGPPALHLLSGVNTDSGRRTRAAAFEGVDDFELERESLFDVITECRVVRRRPSLRILGCCPTTADMSSAHECAPVPGRACRGQSCANMCVCIRVPIVYWSWCLQFKTQEELAIMQYSNDIASAAHVELLRYAKPGEARAHGTRAVQYYSSTLAKCTALGR